MINDMTSILYDQKDKVKIENNSKISTHITIIVQYQYSKFKIPSFKVPVPTTNRPFEYYFKNLQFQNHLDTRG